MHDQAFDWVKRYSTTDIVSVLDIGGRDINGTCRILFPNASPYRVLDILNSPEVDIVEDAAEWIPDRQYDYVLLAEVLEHARLWPDICATAYAACVSRGALIVTTAGPGRLPHSAIDGGPLHADEWYANIAPDDLYDVLADLGFDDVVIDHVGLDVRAYARKP